MACWVLGASPRPLKLCLHLVEIFEVAHVAFRQSHQHRGEGQTQITLIDRMLGPQTLRRGGEKGVATPPCCGALGLAKAGGPRTRHSHDESLRPIQAPGCINHIAVGKRFLALAIGKAQVPRIANRQTRVIWRNGNWPLCGPQAQQLPMAACGCRSTSSAAGSTTGRRRTVSSSSAPKNSFTRTQKCFLGQTILASV